MHSDSEVAIRRWQLVIGAVLALLVALGITTSSIGIPSLRVHETEPAHGQFGGGPDAIRSDEYLRTTPWALGIATRGDDAFGSPLALDDHALATRGTGGVVTTVLFPETQLLRAGGTTLRSQTFALAWWLPTVLVLMLLPVWFRQLGVGAVIGVPLTLVVVFAPVSIWWSWGVLNVLGWAVAAPVAAYAACSSLRSGRRHLITVAYALLAVACAARLGLAYQPWAIPLSVATIAPTVSAVLARRERRRASALLAIGIAGASGALLVGFLAEHRDALRTLGETVYPGTRRFGGQLIDMGPMFGSPHLWFLETAPSLVGTNASELSSAPLLLALCAIVLVSAIDWRVKTFERTATIVSILMLGLLASWCFVAWPAWADRLFPANLVSPIRVAQILGIPAVLSFGLVLRGWRSAPVGGPLAVSIVTGGTAFVTTLISGSALRQGPMPGYPTEWVVGVAAVTAAVVVIAVARLDAWALAPLAAVAVLATVAVNPIQIDGGALVHGAAARDVQQAGGTTDIWASDGTNTDALLMANGRTSLSGQLWVGPESDAWELLDPDRRAYEAWNRAASYVSFVWKSGAATPEITSPAPDVVQVAVDPCAEALDEFDLRWVLSSSALSDAPCLTLRAQFAFGGFVRHLYERS